MGEKKDNIVSEFEVGNTKVKICNDYCQKKGKEEVNGILDRLSKITGANSI